VSVHTLLHMAQAAAFVPRFLLALLQQPVALLARARAQIDELKREKRFSEGDTQDVTRKNWFQTHIQIHQD
jgi:hypothetical protein